MDNEFISTSKASEMFGLSESYLNKLRSKGGGPVFLKIGKRVIYNLNDFKNWLKKHERKNTGNYQ